jgi:acetate kinase
MSQDHILTFNAGSSSIKVGIFSVADGGPRRLANALVDLQHAPLTLRLDADGKSQEVALTAPRTDDLHDVLEEMLGILTARHGLDHLTLVGHRVVHGGDRFTGPVVVSDAVLAGIAELVPLAPLHQPQNLRIIEAVRKLRPEVAQTASFDTAFHAGQTDAIRRFALPRPLFDQGVKRYGFHGLSYKFIAGALAARFPDYANGRVIIAHLGNGASLCALQNGRSVETSMGFSPLDGIPMGTRPGTLDPGVVLHLMRGANVDTVEDLLYHRSGLLGLSGISADTRVLLASTEAAAHEAMAIFTHRTAQFIAALTTTLGGLDALVFTGGIGEHQARTRTMICHHLAWIGVSLNAQANDANRALVHAETSAAAVLVIPTDEEQVIADEAIAAEPTLG